MCYYRIQAREGDSKLRRSSSCYGPHIECVLTAHSRDTGEPGDTGWRDELINNNGVSDEGGKAMFARKLKGYLRAEVGCVFSIGT